VGVLNGGSLSGVPEGLSRTESDPAVSCRHSASGGVSLKENNPGPQPSDLYVLPSPPILQGWLVVWGGR